MLSEARLEAKRAVPALLQDERFQWTLGLVRAALALTSLFFVASCAASEERPPPPRPASSVFSPEAARQAGSAEPANAGLPFAKDPDPTALSEILAAAPKSAPKLVGSDGGSLVGTNTDVKEAPPQETIEKSPSKADKKSSIEEGKPDVAVGIPSPAVERAARAQLYYGLVTRCRDKAGKTLPPDAVELHFRIDTDGYIAPASISAVAVDPAHEDAANCMRRELSAAPFRAPAGARGVAAWVNATVPSVD